MKIVKHYAKNKICLASLMFLIFSNCEAMDAEALFAQVSPSIWVVHTYDAQAKPLALGTAVVISNKHLVTNCHVLAKASSFELRHLNSVYPATLDFADVERDLCQIRFNNPSAPAVKISPINRLRVGQKVFAIGAPRGLEETISDGLLSALRLDNDGNLRYIQTSTPIAHGSSGGGLFNDQGELIGITTLGMDANYAQNIGFAVPAQWILDIEARSKMSAVKSTTTGTTAENIQPKKNPPAPSDLDKNHSTPTTPLAQKWTGLMSCSSRTDNGKNGAAYQVKFSMDVNGSSVSVYRKTDKIAESLTGDLINNTVDLAGVGYHINDPGNIWQFKITGKFSMDAPVFSGKGNMLRDGNSIRSCDIVMAPAQPS